MKVVIQRVSHASVTINGTVKSSIGKGFLILLGIGCEDTQEDIDWRVKKVVNLRVFDDENGVMNRSILDDGGDIIVVSQFTLMHPQRKATALRGFMPLHTNSRCRYTRNSAAISAQHSESPSARANSVPT